MTNIKHDCSILQSKIIGRTLKLCLDDLKGTHRFGKVGLKNLINICPICDANVLNLKNGNRLPFTCLDNVMRTTADLNDSLEFESSNLEFCGFIFSPSALINAIALIQTEDEANKDALSTEDVEKLGAELKNNLNSEYSLGFSNEVCKWGRGLRVLGNLTNRNIDNNLSEQLLAWFQVATETGDIESAISAGIQIKGLGVSFASKHLRMINPNKYAVLDDVISRGIGFALNSKGYKFFIISLQNFKSSYNLNYSLGALESGIFALIRQQVRADS